MPIGLRQRTVPLAAAIHGPTLPHTTFALELGPCVIDWMQTPVRKVSCSSGYPVRTSILCRIKGTRADTSSDL